MLGYRVNVNLKIKKIGEQFSVKQETERMKMMVHWFLAMSNPKTCCFITILKSQNHNKNTLREEMTMHTFKL